MENQNNKANAFQHKRQPQDTNFQGQMKRVLNRLFNRCIQHTRLLPILGSARTDTLGKGINAVYGTTKQAIR